MRFRNDENKKESRMRRLDYNDEATLKVWFWLRSQVKDGLLLSISLAVLEEDLDTLESISSIHFARAEGVGEVSAVACNKALLALELVRAMRLGYRVVGSESGEPSALSIMCEEQGSRLQLMGKGKTYAVMQRSKMLPDAVLAGIRLSLIGAVEAKLGVC